MSFQFLFEYVTQGSVLKLQKEGFFWFHTVWQVRNHYFFQTFFSGGRIDFFLGDFGSGGELPNKAQRACLTQECVTALDSGILR